MANSPLQVGTLVMKPSADHIRPGSPVADAIRAGQVRVNGYGACGGVGLPFGGMKKNGFGREKGFETMHDFSIVKTTVINHS